MEAISGSQIIILEGTDGTGKTTLAKEIARQQDRLILHASKPTHDNWPDEYVEPLAELDQRLVLDRWHLGEYIWPDIMGRKSLFNTHLDLVECNNRLIALGAFTLVLVRSTVDIIVELSSRGESEQDTLNAMAGQSEYSIIARMPGLDNVVVAQLPTARRLLGLK